MQKVFPESECDPACIKAQLNAYHQQCGVNNSTPIKAVETGNSTRAGVKAADQALKNREDAITRAAGARGGGIR